MSPDGWVLVVPMSPDGVQVAAFRSREHAEEIYAGFGGDAGPVTLQAIYFVPDQRV